MNVVPHIVTLNHQLKIIRTVLYLVKKHGLTLKFQSIQTDFKDTSITDLSKYQSTSTILESVIFHFIITSRY